MTKENLLEFEQAEAHHYNALMWTLINIGVGLTLWIIYQVYTESIQINFLKVMIFFGVLVLFYFSVIIEKCNLRIRKSYEYIEKSLNRKVEDYNFIKGIYFLRLIIIALFLSYSITINKVYGGLLHSAIPILLIFLLWCLTSKIEFIKN